MYNDHVRRLEKGLDMEKGFEGVEREGAQEVDAAAEMERAKVEIKDREERKALTTGVTDNNVAPKMNIKVCSHTSTWTRVNADEFAWLKGAALGGRARSRHQLSTLLTEAYSNREELEEKLAQGRRNRKEAGNKYGTSSSNVAYSLLILTVHLRLLMLSRSSLDHSRAHVSMYHSIVKERHITSRQHMQYSTYEH